MNTPAGVLVLASLSLLLLNPPRIKMEEATADSHLRLLPPSHGATDRATEYAAALDEALGR